MRRRSLLLAASSLTLLGALGCAHHYPPPPPPPPPYVQVPPIVQLGDRNGFQTGLADGRRDAVQGYPYGARRTRAYHETPGYDSQLGPFGPYRNAFRNGYLRGYDRGFNGR